MIFGIPKFGNGIGLHRVYSFLDHQGVNLEDLSRKSMVITGSNGKGSVSKLITHSLEKQSFKVFHFSSPHLFNVTERFYHTDYSVTEDELLSIISDVKRFNDEVLVPNGDAFGEFEAIFLAAVVWLFEREFDFAVWEAGIGGRYDPTRLVGAGLTALTAVELEHTELLGPTKELIAYDKLDACRTGGKTVVSNCVDKTLTDRIRAYSRARNVEPLFLSEEVNVTHVLNSTSGQNYSAIIEGVEYKGSLALLGGYQVSNAMTAAFCVAELTGQKCSDSLDQMRDCTWPGRMEKISDDPSIWVDVGHTPEAIEQSVEAFREFIEPKDALVVFGVSDNKEVESIASIVRDNFPNVFLTAANKNGASVQSLKKYFDTNKLVGSSQNISEAAKTVSQKAAKEGKTVLVLGGLFLAVEFKYALSGGDPKELVFF